MEEERRESGRKIGIGRESEENKGR